MSVSGSASRTRQSLWIASIWLGFGLFDATQTVLTMHSVGMHHAWVRLFFALLLGWLPLSLFTPAVLRLARAYPPGQWRRVSFWRIHLPTCVGICLVATAWSARLERSLNPWVPDFQTAPFFRYWLTKFENSLLAYMILYSCILAISYGLASHERLSQQEAETARLNEQLSRAQLHTLRQQIEPHFMFNTLNAVAGLVREGRNDDAVSMIAALSDFLRRVVHTSARHEVTLQEEVQFLERYLEIQQVRFAERLQIEVKVPQELGLARVPSLFLQPIVENAVKHGIARRAKGGAIRVAANRINGDLRISVYNDGPALPPDWANASSGIGISNLRTRLHSLYAERSQFNLRNESDGVEAVVLLPYVLAKDTTA